jgi:hypothetical protein
MKMFFLLFAFCSIQMSFSSIIADNDIVRSYNQLSISVNQVGRVNEDCSITEEVKDSIDSVTSDSCFNEDVLAVINELEDCCCLREDCTFPSNECGNRVVKKGMEMVMSDYKISGSCWTFVNKLYELSGISSANRKVIYKAKKGSLIQDPSLIQPGDWIYHINYSFHNVEHSAVFICWKDYDKKLALTLSHVGQSKYAAGKYGVYDLKGVYHIMRGSMD